MDDKKRQKYERSLTVYGEASPFPSDRLHVGICLTKLERYSEALDTYRWTLRAFLKDRRGWHGTSQPNWLIDCYVLANQQDLYPQVWREIEGYKLDRRGGSLVALYAYAMLRLASGEDSKTTDYIAGLLKKPKVKDMCAAGKAIQSLVDGNQTTLDRALAELLNAHQGMAQHGSLRWSPEGYLCLPVMSLSKMALDRGMAVNVESAYLSKGYLDYLAAV
jgi:hypothetical protein